MTLRVLLILALALLLALVCIPIDPWFWRTCTLSAPDSFRASDIHHIFRQAGHLLPWFLLAVALILSIDLPSRGILPPRHQLLPRFTIFLSPLLAGLLAEILKRLIGRERPGAHDPSGLYTFKPFLHAFTDGSNMGIPSSHAAVAFGGAFMLLRLFPGAGVVALLWATGCAATRILLGAHYLSDVLVAAALGLLASELCAQLLKKKSSPALSAEC